jgi:type I restriction enzyme M protein
MPPRKPAAAKATAAPAAAQTPEERYQAELKALGNHLWGAADILRGSIDSGDYKHYILGLLFYKRLCDVWVEEYEARLVELRGNVAMARHPDEHRFHIPEGAFWDDVRRASVDIGSRLNEAFYAIQDHNSPLVGVFQDVDFANKERFPDRLLELLLNHFEKRRLRKSDVDSTTLGNAYEYLIERFADDAGKKGGEFFTPKAVVRLMVELLDPRPGMTVYDPTCGAGGLLLEAVHHVERLGHPPTSIMLYGQEKNLNTWAICKMSLFLHEVNDAKIERGDTLLDPVHKNPDGRTLRRFDRVLANPPFSLSPWGHEVWGQGDRYGRDVYGCPPKSYGDLAFVQHMLASLVDGGRLAVVVPHGVLFRGGAEGEIRRGMIQDDLIECVVGLGPNLFYGTGIPAAILVMRRGKPADRAGRVLIVNGEKEIQPGKNQNHLSAENVSRLAETVRRFADAPRLSRVVTTDELRQNDHNLNISRYVQTEAPAESLDLAAELAQLRGLTAARDEAEAKMWRLMKELGHGE